MSSNDRRDTDLSRLHPLAREKFNAVLARLTEAKLPFEIFEAYRTPQRQAWLYAQGRTRPGDIVTKADAWQSYHQYGLAADFVLRIDGQWSWTSSGKWKNAWSDLHAIAKKEGLEPLSWELPHLQIAGLSIAGLRAGKYPEKGDEDWADNLEAQIAGWTGGGAPPVPTGIAERPPLAEEAVQEAIDGVSPLAANDVPALGEAGWHRMFGGQEWRYDGNGIYLRGVGGGATPLRTPGKPTTCRAIWDRFGSLIMIMARKYGVAPEILVMTIATETAAYREQGFTGPATFRWEAHVWNNDVSPPVQGDYSAGPMQTLASTARWVIASQQLPYHRFQVAPVYSMRPSPPAEHPLYDPATNIEIGAAEIKQRLSMTGPDPILIAAAFNSGGVRQGDNAWRLKTYGNHLDRAAQWLGDACAVLREVGVR
ncbi:MAG TPA: D-alanyl-D-alanine carboxypeptidase family protein [Devosia sp.]